ncbi:MAG: hypothetical protein IT292_12150 [Deltaproteobacteria bacterium]|nr:hypothetical protein [Deltaproteobacteria bacterium]
MMVATSVNYQLPGNPRYQPRELQELMGYDRLYYWYARVELAVLRALAEIGVINEAEIALLTPDVEKAIYAITTSEVDDIERSLTKHDVRALVNLIKEKLPPALAKWMHIPLTSYDVVEPARILMFAETYKLATRPLIMRLVTVLAAKTREYANEIQIGRTHGQAALPITVGFWLATILSRVLDNWAKLDQFHSELVGKVSGAVGAKNAQVGLLIEAKSEEISFEDRVLKHLGLRSARISTQVLPPEPLGYFLFAHVGMAASLAQFARDARHLMRSEIGEIQEEFQSGQVGSSTMAHKRNPLNFENVDGTFSKIVAEFLKVQLTLISEHQRDLTGSCIMRDFPTIIVDLHLMLNTLLRPGKNGKSFLENITVNKEALLRNFNASAHLVIAEPLYIALQMAGYEGDAHELVNHKLTPKAMKSAKSLIEVLEEKELSCDEALRSAWAKVPTVVKALLANPRGYIGDAADKANAIAACAEKLL